MHQKGEDQRQRTQMKMQQKVHNPSEDAAENQRMEAKIKNDHCIKSNKQLDNARWTESGDQFQKSKKTHFQKAQDPCRDANEEKAKHPLADEGRAKDPFGRLLERSAFQTWQVMQAASWCEATAAICDNRGNGSSKRDFCSLNLCVKYLSSECFPFDLIESPHCRPLGSSCFL